MMSPIAGHCGPPKSRPGAYKRTTKSAGATSRAARPATRAVSARRARASATPIASPAQASTSSRWPNSPMSAALRWTIPGPTTSEKSRYIASPAATRAPSSTHTPVVALWKR